MNSVTVLRVFVCACLLALSSPVFAQGTQVAFGAIQQDTSAPVEVSADELSVDQKTSAATFQGNVVIGQGQMRPLVFTKFNLLLRRCT